MPYPQDLVGKFIGYRLDQGRAESPEALATKVYDGVLRGHVTPADVPVYSFNPGGPGVRGAPAVPRRWTNTNPNWSFTFLQYVTGAVTVASRNKSVLTGPMSGCFLFKYTDQRTGMVVAHVGTANAANSIATKIAKKSWSDVARQRTVSNIAGASPYALFNFDNEIAPAMLAIGHTPMVAGYFEQGDGSAYSMLLSPVPPAMNPPVTPMLKVSLVKRMPLSSWNTIRNLQEFQSST
jgi:hypothetical protein